MPPFVALALRGPIQKEKKLRWILACAPHAQGWPKVPHRCRPFVAFAYAGAHPKRKETKMDPRLREDDAPLTALLSSVRHLQHAISDLFVQHELIIVGDRREHVGEGEPPFCVNA